MKNRRLLYLIGTLVFATFSFAQKESNPSIFIYAKWHNFYSAGVYELGNTNNATGNGLGISLNKEITKRFSLFGGYSFALADSLPYNNFYTGNAIFHQLDVNLALKLGTIWKVKPYIFSGYTYNHIQQIDKFGFNNDGLSINLGTKAEIEIADRIGLGYQMTYGFSLSQNIPFNFKHQLGIVYHPSIGSRRGVNKSREIIVDSEEYENIRLKNDLLSSQVDSMQSVVAQQINNQKEPEEDKSIIANYNIQLQEQVKYLEEDNQRLLEEIRSKRFITDSLYTAIYNGYTVIDISGKVIALQGEDLPSGYYLMSNDFDQLPDAKASLASSHFAPLPIRYILNSKANFKVLGFISTSKEEALFYYTSLEDLKYLVAVVLL
ncbi:MAG: hypothetical protein ACI9AU_001028 [Bacteroidia bacterium]